MSDQPTVPFDDSEPRLERVVLTLCEFCLDGVGGECHAPGCALWMNRAPDVPIRDKIEAVESEDARC